MSRTPTWGPLSPGRSEHPAGRAEKKGGRSRVTRGLPDRFCGGRRSGSATGSWPLARGGRGAGGCSGARLHEVLLAELRAAGLLDMDDASIDASHVRALKRGAHTGPSPVDRARPGSKHHLIVDRHGTPLVVSLTSGNRHDVTQLMPLLDAMPRIRGLRGRPRHRPRRLFADRGYDFDKYRRQIRTRGITPKIARRGKPHGSGLAKTRWVVERTFAWLHQFKRRLRIRYEIRADLHLGLLQLACSIICLRRLRTSF
ncbi:IS5 family transposase [Streptomyces sp. NPDC001568]|uniref:IS5 family transposase n=1 Tax=Streptomyces sp. NPDC001568 TaxID=3364588 RepID=UPI00368A5387